MKPRLFISIPPKNWVYHGDRGHLNALWNIAHQIISPDSYRCARCALTHGALRECGAWKAFRERHPGRLTVVHCDEFHCRYPDVTVPTPYVFVWQEEGAWTVALAGEVLAVLPGVDALVERLDHIREALNRA